MRNEKVIKSAEAAVKGFFGSSLEELDITSHERLVDVSVVYRDFKPVSDARAWLNSHIPYLWSVDVERVYSDEMTDAALRCLYEHDNDVREKVEEILFTEDAPPACSVG